MKETDAWKMQMQLADCSTFIYNFLEVEEGRVKVWCPQLAGWREGRVIPARAAGEFLCILYSEMKQASSFAWETTSSARGWYECKVTVWPATRWCR